MLKRVGAIALVLVMVFALAACGKKESKTVKAFEGINEDSGYHVDLEMDLEGQTIRMNMQAKDDLFYADATVSGEKILMIRNADGFYMLMPSMMLGLKSTDSSEMDQAIEDIGLFVDIGEDAKEEKFTTGEMEVDGTKYYYEEFEGSEEDGNARFLFEEEDLRYIVLMNGEEIGDKIKIYTLDTQIDDALFKVPEGYTITEGEL